MDEEHQALREQIRALLHISDRQTADLLALRLLIKAVIRADPERHAAIEQALAAEQELFLTHALPSDLPDAEVLRPVEKARQVLRSLKPHR